MDVSHSGVGDFTEDQVPESGKRSVVWLQERHDSGLTCTASLCGALEVDEFNVVVDGVTFHGTSFGVEEGQHVPLFFTVTVFALGRHVGDDATGCCAVVTAATLRAIHVVLELTVDLRVKDLSGAIAVGKDTKTISAVN